MTLSCIGIRPLAAALLAALAGSCSGQPEPLAERPGQHELGQSDFVSYAGGGRGSNSPGLGNDDANFSEGAPSAEQGTSGEPREVEEADLVFVHGDLFFVLNHYRGLFVFDVSTPDEPRLLSNVKVFGFPVEMMVHGGVASLVISDYFTYWRNSATDDLDAWHGSQVVFVDIRQPSQARVIGTVPLEGFVQATRRVGDVLYVTSTRWAWYYGCGSDDQQTMTYVAALDISDPARVAEVARVEFPGYSAEVHASPEALYVAQYDYTGYSGAPSGTMAGATSFLPAGYQGPITTVSVVDISDPAGALVSRGRFTVQGYLFDRHQMDEYTYGDGLRTFRLVTHVWSGQGDSFLSTLDMSDPDAPALLSSLLIDDAGSLMATRFAGERGYTIHLPYSIDPLDVLDLSDPQRPVLTAILEIPGWITHLEVRGDRLLGLGVDGEGRVALSLFDVADARRPLLLDRVPVTADGAYSWSLANWDDKALTVVDELGLALVPFGFWGYDEQGGYRYGNGVQLVDFDRQDLASRGVLADTGWVQRTRAVGTQRVLAVAGDALSVFDIQDRDQPAVTARVELATYVDEVFGLDQQHLLVSTIDLGRGQGAHQLRVIPRAAPSEANAIAAVTVADAAYYWSHADVRVQAPYAYAFANVGLPDGSGTGLRVEVFDFSSPAAPAQRASATLPIGAGASYCWDWCSYGSIGNVFLLPGGKAVVAPEYWGYWDLDGLAETGADSAGTAGAAPALRAYVLDLLAEGGPAILASVDLPGDLQYLYGWQLSGSTLYYSSYRATGTDPQTGAAIGRYYLGRVALADPAAPALQPEINVPGYFVGATEDGQKLITTDWRYLEPTGADSYGTWEQYVHVLALPAGAPHATLLASRLVADGNAWVSGYLLDGQRLLLGRSTWSYDDASCWYGSYAYELLALDLSAPQLPLATVLDLDEGGWWTYLMALEDGRAVLGVDGGVLVYDLAATPAVLTGFYRTYGWYTWRVLVEGDALYLPSGYYGLQAIGLSDGELIY